MKIKILLICFVISLSSYGQPASSKKSDKAINNTSEKLSQELKEKGLVLGSPLFIRIFKESNELEVFVRKGDKFELFKTYAICAYSGVEGPKKSADDGQSPEGMYRLNHASLDPDSKLNLAINIGYPNAFDLSNGYSGGPALIHGGCKTDGGYALADSTMEQVWTLVHKAFSGKLKTIELHIYPFRLTDAKMKKEINSEFYPFWQNLKQGYDIFEKYNKPPGVEGKAKRYYFKEPVQN